jgi:hypothetical protein
MSDADDAPRAPSPAEPQQPGALAPSSSPDGGVAEAAALVLCHLVAPFPQQRSPADAAAILQVLSQIEAGVSPPPTPAFSELLKQAKEAELRRLATHLSSVVSHLSSVHSYVNRGRDMLSGVNQWLAAAAEPGFYTAPPPPHAAPAAAAPQAAAFSPEALFAQVFTAALGGGGGASAAAPAQTQTQTPAAGAHSFFV